MSRFSNGTVGRIGLKSVAKCQNKKVLLPQPLLLLLMPMLLLGCCCGNFWCDILVLRMPYFISIAKSVMLQRFMCAVTTDDDAAAAF